MAEEKRTELAARAPREQETASAAGAPAAAAQRPAAPPGGKQTKKKRRLIRGIVLAAVLLAATGGAVWGGMKLFGGGSGQGEVLTAWVEQGSITSTISGEGLTRAQNSATMTITVSGTVQDVFVKEGDSVEAGQQLYVIRSPAAEDAVTAARKEVEDCTREMGKLQEARANLTVRAPFSGKLLVSTENGEIRVGDDVSSGRSLGTVVDDSKMRLRQYYSYAYAGQIKVGQSASVSIPSSMATVQGKVAEVHMVERISAEGTKLFEVDIVLDNPGTLTAGVDATAALTVGSETAYPYEAGKLEYNRSAEIVTKVGGPAQKVNLRNYARVSAGDVLLVMGGDENETAMFNLDTRMKTAQKNLDEAQKAMDLLNGTAPISGTVMSVPIEPGQEVAAGYAVMVISDNSTILLDAQVDERNIAYVHEGMSVDIDQWGTQTVGEVTSVSLTSKTENGVATFPAVISIDNSDGLLMPGSYANYTLVASQNDDCLVLPIQAVKSVETAEGTRSVVFVRADTRPEGALDLDAPVDGVPEKGYYPVPVTTGISDNQNVEILSGVEAGTEVFQQIVTGEMMY